MTFDPVRGRIVLFGGETATPDGLVADTWLWDGTNWQSSDLTLSVVSPPEIVYSGSNLIYAVTVTNVAPTVSITGAPASSPEGTAISLGSTVTDPSVADTAAGFTYAWSVTKNGNPFASGSNTSLSFTPDDNGTYVVSLTVTDDDGGSGSDSETVTVTNVAPVPTNDSPKAERQYSDFIVPVTVSASDAGSADTLSASIVSGLPADSGLSLSWDSATNTGTLSGKANLAPGTFNIVVRVTDDDGGFGDTTIVLTVTPEDAASEYTGIEYVTTDSTRTSTASFTVTSSRRTSCWTARDG